MAPSMARQLRRRAGIPKSINRASAAPPADGQKNFLVWLREEVAAVVAMESVEDCAVVPVKLVNEAGVMLQVAGSVAALVTNAQVRATVPVNPVCGVTVMVAVLPVVEPGRTVNAEHEMVKVGGGGAVVVKDASAPVVVPAALWATAW